MNIVIRSSEISDLVSIRKILEGNWIGINGLVQDDEIEYILKLIENSINKTDNAIKFKEHYIVADIGKEIVGILGYRKLFYKFRSFAKTDNPIELHILFILKDRIKNGIGTALIDNLVNMAPDEGYSEIIVKSSDRWKNSWDFYDKIGFERVGRTKSDSGNITQIWSKQINI